MNSDERLVGGFLDRALEAIILYPIHPVPDQRRGNRGVATGSQSGGNPNREGKAADREGDSVCGVREICSEELAGTRELYEQGAETTTRPRPALPKGSSDL
jgi:hypothetical protein